MSAQPAAVKVLFIAGTGRSGTTILSSILGQVPGCFSAGELRYTWERGLLEDHRCGCGRPFSRCPIWTGVMAEAFRDRQLPNARSLSARLERRLRTRRMPLTVLRRMTGRAAVEPHGDDDDIRRLYQGLSSHPGVKVVVDSSKLPSYGMLVSSLPGVEVSVVHVVRDPRATAFSWRRAKVTYDRDDHAASMPRLQSWRSACIWIAGNLLTDLWWPRSSTDRVLVRYEDLVREPAATIARVLDLAGVELPPDLVRNRSVNLSPTHSVAGNPNRHLAGVVNLHPDDEWQRDMRPAERLLVTVLTLPGLRRFGYRVSTRSKELTGS